MARKTAAIEFILKEANQLLKESDSTPDFRNGVLILLERILYETDNYNGFYYLTEDQMPANQLPGIRYITKGNNITPSFENTDRTRVQYY